MHLLSEQKCPYCEAKLLKEPKRGATCKKCGKVFHVVTRPSDRKKVIVTEEEQRVFQEEWLGQDELMLLKNTIARLYLKEADFKKAFDAESKLLEKKFGSLPQAKDVLWGLANALIAEKIRAGDWNNLSNLYGDMGRYLYFSGKPSMQFQQEAKKCELRYYKQMGITKVQIIGGDTCCATCTRHSGKQVTTDTALKEMALPQKECTNLLSHDAHSPDSWCVCGYTMEID